MQIDPEEVSTGLIYSTMIRAIAPRPIAWVSTLSPNNITNLAPFSYFNGIGSQPAALMFSAVNHPDGSKKDTIRNIESNREFVVNVVPFSAAAAMQATAANLDYEVSEFANAGLTEKQSMKVAPPGVEESPIQFECELIDIVAVGSGPLAANVVFGKILLINVRDQILNDQNKIDPDKLDAIGRMGGLSYCRTNQRFEIDR